MRYIEDPVLFKAVSFARALKKKMSIPLAVSKAAKYYGVSQESVASELGKIGGTKVRDKKIWNAYQRGKNEER